MKITILTLVAACAAVLSSCDSPDLVKKKEQQASEIKKLEVELAGVREQLKEVPEKKPEDVASLEKQAKSQKEEAAKLEKEVQEIQEQKATLEKEFGDYKQKYVVR